MFQLSFSAATREKKEKIRKSLLTWNKEREREIERESARKRIFLEWHERSSSSFFSCHSIVVMLLRDGSLLQQRRRRQIRIDPKSRVEGMLTSRETSLCSAAYFCFNHLRSLITNMFQGSSDVDFSCSFADAVQDDIQENVGSRARHTITGKSSAQF